MDHSLLVRNKNLSFFQKEDGRVLVFNHDDAKSYILSYDACQLLWRLDGTSSLQDIYNDFTPLPETEIDQTIAMFEKIGLIGGEHEKKKRFVLWKDPENIIIIKNKNIRSAVRGLLLASPFLFLTELFYLWSLHLKLSVNIDKPFLALAVIVLIISTFVHEMAHAVFAKSYNANIGEIALIFEAAFPHMRIYTNICGFSYITKTSQKIKMHLAGILAQIFLMALSILMIGCPVAAVSRAGICVFLVNGLCVVVDSIPFRTSDGSRVLQTIRDRNKTAEG